MQETVNSEIVISEKLLIQAEAGEKEALIRLDEAGLPLVPGEELGVYSKRLNSLRERLREMEQELEENGEFICEDLHLHREHRIPVDLLRECTGATVEQYGFAVDWVPAFYINPSFSWLFGGCAYYFYPDMFALMIIRRSFARRRKWFIYDRNEILAHEMCHVARLGFNSVAYEERFAYRVSQSGFRRRFGGIFESPRDSFLLLGSTFLLLAAQTLQMLFWTRLPIWPFWSLVGGVAGYLLGRDRQRHRCLRQAEVNLQRFLGASGQGVNVAAILFRCTDQEIGVIAETRTKADFSQWLERNIAAEYRWRVIAWRFIPVMPNPDSD